MSMADNAEVCGCNGVCKGTIVKAIQEHGLFILRSEFPNPDLDLLPGSFIRVRLEQAVNQQGISVPQRATGTNPTPTPRAAASTSVSDESNIQPRRCGGGRPAALNQSDHSSIR